MKGEVVMHNALTAFIAAVFMLGTAIFYVLSCIERSVLGLVFGKNKNITEEDIRFTHASLKRLSPLLPSLCDMSHNEENAPFDDIDGYPYLETHHLQY